MRVRLALVALVVVTAGCSSRRQPPAPDIDRGSTAVAPSSPPDSADPVDPAEDVPEAKSSVETVTIKLVADARRGARVFWGRKDLGLAPLELTRPRDSGPLDLLVVAPGYLPLHTRVFSDRDETLALRLYSEKDAAALLGYRPPEAGE